MKKLSTLTDSELLIEYENCSECWSGYSYDCFGFYVIAIQREKTKRSLRPMVPVRTCSDKELQREINDYASHPEAFAYDQIEGTFQGYYLSQLIKECILRKLEIPDVFSVTS